jgi:hypothetical protein
VKPSRITKRAKVEELWRRGAISWKLYPDQREVYEAIQAFLKDPTTIYSEFYVDICRQFGKTFAGLLIADEFAREKEQRRILYTCATRTALWQFVQPNVQTLLRDCPQDLRPLWSTTENSYRYPNGSIIHLAGVNNNHEDDARGPKADLIINEEAAFVDRLKYLIESIERPMLLTTGGRMIHITTRPESPDHHSSKVRESCEAKGQYIKRTLDDVTHLSKAAKSALIEESGGMESTTVQREFFCMDVVERERAIIPEFSKAMDAIVMEWERPRHWRAYEVMDPGYSPSQTAILFGYYDFRAGLYIIEDELMVSHMRTDQLAERLWHKEAELWPTLRRERSFEAQAWYRKHLAKESETVNEDRVKYCYDVKHRWSDILPVWLNDLGSMHKVSFQQTAKDDVLAQINVVRIWTKQERYRIHPRCKSLIAQCKGGVWNKSRSDFELSPDYGHYDGISALVYGVRNCPVNENPYPVIDDGVDVATHHIPPWVLEKAKNKDTHAARAIFGGIFHGKR